MRGAWNDTQRCTCDKLRSPESGVTDRYNLVIIAVKDKRWHIDALQIFRKIGSEKALLMQSKAACARTTFPATRRICFSTPVKIFAGPY